MKVFVIRKKMMMLFSFILVVGICSTLGMNTVVNTFSSKEIEEPIRCGDEGVNKMAFTCNIDWGNEEVMKLLDLFDQKNIRITFFVTGRWASLNPEIVKEIHKRGHEIGNHAYRHKMHSKISKEENYNEIKKTDDVIVDIIGVKPKYFAPPSGDFNDTTLKVAKELGYTTILWSIDTIDWREGSTKDVIIKRVMKKPHKGAILLMHPKPATVKALPYIIDKIKEKGIEIGKISDLIE